MTSRQPPTRDPRTVTRRGAFGAITSAIRRRPVAAYVVIASGLSWTYWLSMLLRGEVVTPGGSTSHVPGLFGPLFAAFIVTALITGRAGIADLVARMFRWRVGVRWFALAAIPFMLFVVGVAALAAAGGRSPTLDDLGTYSGLPALGLPAVVLLALVAAFGEEVGWRGFAQPQLERRLSFLRASIVVGVIWAVWHVPSFPIIETYRQMGLGVLPLFVFGLGSGAIVLAWLYDRSGGSILVAALFHLGLNMGSATLAGRGLPAALASTGIIVWAVVIVGAELRRSRRVSRPVGALLPARRSRVAEMRDASVRLLLGSPLYRLVGPGVLLLTFRGRTTGHRYTIPVEYVREGGRLIVLVAHPATKQWWRNVRHDSAVSVRFDGHDRAADATVEVGTAETASDLARYLAARPRSLGVASASQDEAVVVRLELEPALSAAGIG